MKVINRAGRVACVPFDGERSTLVLFGGAKTEVVSCPNGINRQSLTI